MGKENFIIVVGVSESHQTKGLEGAQGRLISVSVHTCRMGLEIIHVAT